MKKASIKAILAGVLAAACAFTGCASPKAADAGAALEQADAPQAVETPAPTPTPVPTPMPIPTPVPELNNREDALNDDIVEQAVNKLFANLEQATLVEAEILEELVSRRGEVEDLIRLNCGVPTKDRFTEEGLTDLLELLSEFRDTDFWSIIRGYIKFIDIPEVLVLVDMSPLYPKSSEERIICEEALDFKKQLYLNLDDEEAFIEACQSGLVYAYSKWGAFGDIGVEIADLETLGAKINATEEVRSLAIVEALDLEGYVEFTLKYPEGFKSSKKTFRPSDITRLYMDGTLILPYKYIEEAIASQ